MRTAIIVPARYCSTRMPGKPLAMIAGRTMLERVVCLAQQAADDTHIYVATDDARIAEHCSMLGVDCIMTDDTCESGTDRVAQAVRQLNDMPDFVLNMQGDAPLTPPAMIRAMIDAFAAQQSDVVTPVCQLSWNELDMLRASKQQTPFSGTCAVFHPETYRAYWFSKHIIPALRKEATLRDAGTLSPVYQHIGLYGYAPEALQRYTALPSSHYEVYEGLEQLRLLEAGMRIRVVPVAHNAAGLGGVDSPEDIARVEAYITQHGDPMESTG